jgi:TonB family protein
VAEENKMAQATLEKANNPDNPEVKPRRSKRAIVHRFIDRNRLNVGLTVSTILQLLVLFFWYTPEINFGSLDKFVDEVAFVDSVSITENVADTPTDGDVELADQLKKEIKEDPRIAGAQDSILSGATAPIDLSPSIKPDYTDEARAAGIEGAMTLEIIIADTGDVLQVRSIGKKFGFGLEEDAIKIYRSKKFSPSYLEGKAITVKVLVPIRFKLN